MIRTYLPLLFAFSAVTAMADAIDDAVIPQASYMIYDGKTDMTAVIPRTSRYVTFYTFDGNPIQTVEHKFCFPEMEHKLDPAAPKPQPTTYAIKYWPAIRAHRGILRAHRGIIKGVPGYFIIFYDKHGNVIERYRYDKRKDVITVFETCGLRVSERQFHCETVKLGQARMLNLLRRSTEFPLDLSRVNEQR